jgi:transposase
MTENRYIAPKSHLLDAGYINVEQLLTSQQEYGIDIVGPVLGDTSWQARAQQGFDASHFELDWEKQQARCPTGQLSQSWKSAQDRHGTSMVNITFAYAACKACPEREKCTKSQKHGRGLGIRPQAEHQALQQVRLAQTTEAFQKQYAQRAGIEGTLAQGIKAFGLRRCRYMGLAKAHLQHVITATAMNVVRLVNWWQDTPFAATRRSHFAALAPLA